MNAEVLLRDPGFQLNLLLWMTREQPHNAYLVRPLFRELGFDLLYIENPFPLPEETARAANATGLDISMKPEPDVLLGRNADMKALYIEIKAAAFSAASSSARQARGHALAAGPAFAEVMKPFQQCLLCYVTPAADGAQMDECLAKLRDELDHAGLELGPQSIHGLALTGSNVVYSWDAGFRVFSGTPGDSEIILRNITDDTDPSPLFLVFSDQDYPDPEKQDLCRRALQNQVHAVLLCELNRSSWDTVYTRTLDGLLEETTDGVFRYVGGDRRKRMRRLVRENLFKRIFGFWREKEPGLVCLADDTLKVQYRDASQQEALLDWLEDYRRVGFCTATPPQEEPLPLLQMMGMENRLPADRTCGGEDG